MLQASNEFNTGGKIFLYVPEQSMTDSEVTEVKRLLEQVKGILHENELFVLDFKEVVSILEMGCYNQVRSNV